MDIPGNFYILWNYPANDKQNRKEGMARIKKNLDYFSIKKYIIMHNNRTCSKYEVTM